MKLIQVKMIEDNIPGSMHATGAEVITCSAPVLSGAITWLHALMRFRSWDWRDVPCTLRLFDFFVPAGNKLMRKDIISFGHQGMGAGCDPCHFPERGWGR